MVQFGGQTAIKLAQAGRHGLPILGTPPTAWTPPRIGSGLTRF
ncbi:MAG: hypothetical protein ACLT5P_01940 [Flavonifractor plautii]